jgi:hypothetical protein
MKPWLRKKKGNDFKDIHILPKKIEKSSPSKVVVSGISERRIFCVFTWDVLGYFF